MSTPLRAAVVLLSLSSLAGCSKALARSPVASPTLIVPAPEPRLLIPAPAVEAPVEIPTPPNPPPAAAQPPRQNNTPASRPSQPAPPAPQPVTPPPAAEPPQVLQTTQRVSDLENRALNLLQNAEQDLKRVPSDLSNDGKAQLREAQDFVRQSRAAINSKNFVLAVELAGKAATLAGQLVKGDPPA